MLKFGHRLRANYSNLIDICEGDGPPCDLITSLYNLDLDSAVICELDIEEFSAKLEVLIEVPKANTFYAIVLTESGQLKKIDLAETYEWLVESPRKSVFQRVFERELELNKKYFVIKLLYPSLLSYGFSVDSIKHELLSKDNELTRIYSDQHRYDAVCDELKEVLNAAKNKHHEILTWNSINQYFGKAILFGVKKSYDDYQRHTAYYRFSDQFINLMNLLSCTDNRFIDRAGCNEKWLTIEESDEFLYRYYSTFTEEFEKIMVDLIDEDNESVLDFLDEIDELQQNQRTLSIQNRCYLNRIHIFHVWRFWDLKFDS